MLVQLTHPLDREAYSARLGLEPGFVAVYGEDRADEADVVLYDRCPGLTGDASAAPRLVLHDRSQRVPACHCCRSAPREANWHGLVTALRQVAGVSRPAPPAELANLTRREMDVLRLVGQGKTVSQCAEAMGVSPSTVGNHKYRLMRKLGVSTSLQLLRIAVRNGLADL